MPENDGDAEQRTLFPIRSDLAVIKEGAGALNVETVLDEIAKLEQLRELGLPEDLFWDVPAKLVTQYRQRAGTVSDSKLNATESPKLFATEKKSHDIIVLLLE
jgi:hypothetical protein